MNGIEQLHAKNHTLYRRVQHLVSLQWRWDAIASEVGLVGPRAVQDLCEWVLEYREPKELPKVSSVPVYTPPPNSMLHVPNAARFLAWRRQHEGARKTLEEAGL